MTHAGVSQASALGAAYERIYGILAGTRPSLRPWHFQWLATCDIRRDMAKVLPACTGRLLDIGCGAKPYRVFASGVDDYIGVDIESGPEVDHLLVPGQPLPLPDASIDAVLCTQVLEHVEDFNQVWGEILRVLRRGGRLVVTIPFIFNEHGSPHDYRRLSTHGIRAVAERDFDVIEVRMQGGIGSTAVMLVLNWWEVTLSLTRPTRLLKGLLLPLWLPVCGVANLAGWGLDRIDRTRMFYHNVMLVAIRR